MKKISAAMLVLSIGLMAGYLVKGSMAMPNDDEYVKTPSELHSTVENMVTKKTDLSEKANDSQNTVKEALDELNEETE